MNFYGGKPGTEFKIETVVTTVQELLDSKLYGVYILISNSKVEQIIGTINNIERDYQNTLWIKSKEQNGADKYYFVANFTISNTILNGCNASSYKYYQEVINNDNI